MFASDLFCNNRLINGEAYRNIVSLRNLKNIFSELSDDPFDNAVAVQAELETHKSIEPKFAYNTAITYPFIAKPYLDNRFGDGSYGVWYGSMDLNTTIFETCYHIYKAIISVQDYPAVVKHERSVFTVCCEGVLIDLSDKVKKHPDLVFDDYSFCQMIGKKLHKEGHPGILYASARTNGEKKIILRETAEELLNIDTCKSFGL